MLVPILATIVLAVVSAAPQNYGERISHPDIPTDQYGGSKVLPMPVPKDIRAQPYGGGKLPEKDNSDIDTDTNTDMDSYGGQHLLPSGGSDLPRPVLPKVDRTDSDSNAYGGDKHIDSKEHADPSLPSNSYGGFKPLPPSDIPKPPSNSYGGFKPLPPSDIPKPPSNSYGGFKPSDSIDHPDKPSNSYGGGDKTPEKPSGPIVPDNSYGGVRPLPLPLPADVPKGSSYGGDKPSNSYDSSIKRPADVEEKRSDSYGGFHPLPPKDTLPIAPNPYGNNRPSGDVEKPSNPYS